MTAPAPRKTRLRSAAALNPELVFIRLPLRHRARSHPSRVSVLAVLGVITLSVFPATAQLESVRFSGKSMSTTYEVVYAVTNEVASRNTEGLQAQIDSLLKDLNASFSTYDPASTISLINASRDTSKLHLVKEDFAIVFRRASEIYFDSGKTFNPAIGPLTLAWGIASTTEEMPDEALLERLQSASNMTHFLLSANGTSPSLIRTVQKYDSLAALDFNGIAKGYAVDKMAELMRDWGYGQFLVELGGEIRTVGNHPTGRPWQIAIEFPSISESRTQAVLSISDVSVATSGNYQTVRYAQGVKIVHTIEPRAGRPHASDLLSVTVLAHDCMTADAYATALMVMGSEKAIEFLASRPDLDAYMLIGQDETDFEIYHTAGMKARLIGQ